MGEVFSFSLSLFLSDLILYLKNKKGSFIRIDFSSSKTMMLSRSLLDRVATPAAHSIVASTG